MTTATQTKSELSAIVNTEELRQIVDAAGSAVNSRMPKPVLACLRITATENGIEAHGTDLEKSVTADTSQVQIESIGSVLVDAKKFASAIQHIQDDTVHLSFEKTSLVVRLSDGEFKLATISVAEYPPSGEIPAPDFSVDAMQFSALLESVFWAGNPGPIKGNPRGHVVNLEIKVGKLCLASGEGKKLSINEIAIQSKASASAMVPMETMGVVRKICKPEESLGITLAKSAAYFECGGVKIATNLVEGNYWPYADILAPTDTMLVETVGTESLSSSLASAGIFIGEELSESRLSFSKSKGIEISSTGGGGSVRRMVACKSTGDCEIWASTKLLSAAVAGCPSDEIEIRIFAPNRPIIFASKSWRGVVMPINKPRGES